jgi:hypothetical protein
MCVNPRHNLPPYELIIIPQCTGQTWRVYCAKDAKNRAFEKDLVSLSKLIAL